MPIALLREMADTFDRAIVRVPGRPIDVELAGEQHAAYRSQLEAAGYSVEVVPADDGQPDCVFVEDTAVIVGELAVLTRSGAPRRRGEIAAVADRLASRFPTTTIEAPGTVDGGDVMRVGDTFFLGLSERSNRSGVDQLAGIVERQGLHPVVIPVSEALHLKSGVLPVDGSTVVVTEGVVDIDLLEGLDIVFESGDERFRFSALPLVSGEVLVTSAAPETSDMLARRGLDLIPIDISEILAADGGLTCMSILF
jgi:dimethylargininase